MVAALTPQVLWSEGTLFRIIVYRIYGAIQNDTVETSTEFKKVYNWSWYPATGASAQTNWSSTVTTLTKIVLSAASIATDDGYLIVIGSSLQQ